jgi:hypothetical protein
MKKSNGGAITANCDYVSQIYEDYQETSSMSSPFILVDTLFKE